LDSCGIRLQYIYYPKTILKDVLVKSREIRDLGDSRKVVSIL
jgi:hypothetical protein